MADDGVATRPRTQSCGSRTYHKRAPKLTERGLEELLNRFINTRRSKLSQLTLKMNKINGLMKDSESPDIIDEHLTEYSKLLREFGHANDDVLRLLPDDEKDADQTFWFKPKHEQFDKFIKN